MKKTLCLILASMLGASAFGNLMMQIISTHNGHGASTGQSSTLPDEGMVSLAGLDYSGFSIFPVAVVTNQPTLEYDVYEWTRIADEDGVIITSGGDQ